MSTQEPTLAEVVDAAMRSRMKEMFGCWLPARIESYDASTNKASVQVLVLDDYEDEAGDRQTERFPVINDVPVGWPSIGGKFCLKTTLSAGDVVVVMFASRPVDKWLSTGGFVDPEDNRHHDINDAFILPYRVDFGASNASTMINITATEIQCGGTEPLVTRSEFLNHGHPIIATGATSPCTGPVAAPTPGTVSDFPGTSKLRG